MNSRQETAAQRLTLLLLLGISTPLAAQNTNEDAPEASNTLVFADETKIEISYRQLTLAGGRNLKTLMSKGVQGDSARKYYNEQYLPAFLDGSIELTSAIALGQQEVKKGVYGFTFRLDGELTWLFVLTKGPKDVCDIALEAETNKRKQAKRLIVQPIATADDETEGFLSIRYGPLSAKVPFSPSKATTAGK